WVVRAHVKGRELGLRIVVGCRLDLVDGTSLLAWPTDRPAYARLSSLLTLGKRRAAKAKCRLTLDDLTAHGDGLLLALADAVPGDAALPARLAMLRERWPERLWLAIRHGFCGDDMARLAALAEVARGAGVPLLATNDVHYHVPERRPLQDVVTCIREKCRLDEAGARLFANAERHLKAPAEMARLLAPWPEALAASLEIVARCRFSLDELAYDYPVQDSYDGRTPQQELERRTWLGAAWRYGKVPETVEETLRHELALIAELRYAPYFLTVHDIVSYARSRGILCLGRGSAANSAVCYVLGVTAVDPARVDLLFERFVSAERNEPPDIDVDFEHGRREEVIQHIYSTYGRDHAALAATVIRYRAKSAIREVGKVMGLSADAQDAMSRTVWGCGKEGLRSDWIRQAGLDPADPLIRRTLQLAQELIDFPRHLSQHVGGFVIARSPLRELVPIENAAMPDRTVVEWDKDDLEALRMLKIDVLALGMLTCIRNAFDLLRSHYGVDLDLAKVPPEDPAVYEMLSDADSIGVFQVESRAQMSMLPRLKPRCFYDLVIEVAIVRPGPIQGDMVHPYLRRREGKEPVVYPKPEFEKVLGKTLGVPLFQEQAMAVAIHCAGFTPAEADQLRRSMATFKFTGGVVHFRDKLIGGMIANGYDPAFARRTFRQLEGFGSYGFPMSHAASFALLAYASSWMKHHHPEVFLAAILNSQPMGFYAPAQLVGCARRHGVVVHPIDVNHSRWDCTLEPLPNGDLAVRLGLRMVRGLADKDAARLVGARDVPYAGIAGLQRRAGLGSRALRCLADADAYRSLAPSRRAAAWAIRALREAPLPLFTAADGREGTPAAEIVEPQVALPPAPAGGEVVDDFAATGLSLRAHPLAFLRAALSRRGVLAAAGLEQAADGQRVRVAGLVLVRQRPGSAKGVLFITLEDETGPANLIVWPALFERYRRVVLSAGMLGCEGRLQREGGVIHVIAARLLDLTAALHRIGRRQHFPVPPGRGDAARGGSPDPRDAPRDPRPSGPPPRDIYIRDLHIDRPLPLKPRNFR
ncbi:MAG: error-prone DNA polymerase, partial [Rhodospirillales bacterium]|nr:error-prone DNA polymerase [Rhodospirillales bacterium]